MRAQRSSWEDAVAGMVGYGTSESPTVEEVLAAQARAGTWAGNLEMSIASSLWDVQIVLLSPDMYRKHVAHVCLRTRHYTPLIRIGSSLNPLLEGSPPVQPTLVPPPRAGEGLGNEGELE